MKTGPLAKTSPSPALLYFLHSTRYCCFRLHNGISRLFADTNVRDHPSFVARARSQPCLCPIPCIVDTQYHVGTPTCVEFESITNLSVPPSLSLPSTYTLRTRQFLSFFTSVAHTCNTRWNAFLLRFLARFRYKWDEKNGRGEGGLFVGIIGRFEGGKEVGSRFEGTYSWEEIDGGREEIR